MSQTFDIKDLERRMRAGIDTLKKEFSGLRTGRASAHLLDPVQVMLYGSRMPLAQCATVSTPDAKTISVSVWDKSQVKAVEKAIADANLGLTPKTDGNMIRLSVPPLTGDRRAELAKLAAKYGEAGRVAVRNVRRDGMDVLKKLEKDGKMTEDDSRKNGTKVQELTDKLIKEIDQLTTAKEAEIKQV
jgi:ribosome recycling factor